MTKNSFRDPVTGQLKGWGFTTTNAPGDIIQAEADDFNLDPSDGWKWSGTSWVVSPPATLVPVFVTMRQARLALLGAGLLASVNSSVSAMTGPAGDAARIEWEFANEVRRDSTLVAAMASSLSLSAAALDALFITAATL